MADKIFYDLSGKPLDTSGSPAELSGKRYFDANGKPLDSQTSDKFANPITATSEKVAPWAGRAATEALPAIGSFVGVGGTLVGTGISQMMKRARPDLFGEQPQGIDAGLNAGKELLLNNVLPAGLGKLGGLALKTDMQGIGPTIAAKLSNFPAVRNALTKNVADQAFARLYQREPIIEQGAENVAQKYGEMKDAVSSLREQYPDIPSSNYTKFSSAESQKFPNGVPISVETPGGPHPQVQAAMDHLGEVFGKNRIGGMLRTMQKEAQTADGDIARTQTYKEIANTTLSDVANTHNARIAAGQEFTNDMAVNKLLTQHADPVAGTINAAAVLKEMGGVNKGIYDEAMNPASKKSFEGLMGELTGYEKKNVTDRVISFTQGHLVWNLAGGAGIGALFGHPLSGAALGLLKTAPIATDLMLRRIMQNPETVQLVRLALKTPLDSTAAPFLQKALTQILPRIIQGEADLATVPSQ